MLAGLIFKNLPLEKSNSISSVSPVPADVDADKIKLYRAFDLRFDNTINCLSF